MASKSSSIKTEFSNTDLYGYNSESFAKGIWAWAEENCTQEDMENYTGPE